MMFSIMLGLAAIAGTPQDRSVAGIALDAPKADDPVYDDGNWTVLAHPEQGRCMAYADSLTSGDVAPNDSGITAADGGSMQIFAYFDQPDSYILAFRWADSPQMTGSVSAEITGYAADGTELPKTSMALEMREGFAMKAVPVRRDFDVAKIAVRIPGHASFAIKIAGGNEMLKALEQCRARKGA